jgi:hypothetical protein
MDAHTAEHVLLECLGEIIFAAQKSGQQMDAVAYVDKIRRAGSQI